MCRGHLLRPSPLSKHDPVQPIDWRMPSLAQSGQTVRGAGRTPFDVKDDPGHSLLSAASCDRHPNSLPCQFRIGMAAGGVARQPTGKQVDPCGQIEPAFLGKDLGHIPNHLCSVPAVKSRCTRSGNAVCPAWPDSSAVSSHTRPTFTQSTFLGWLDSGNARGISRT